MLDLDRTLFYKAKFDIEDQTGNDVLWNLCLNIRRWATYKARRDRYEFNIPTNELSQFKAGSKLQSSRSDIYLKSAAHFNKEVDGEIVSWACKHHETSDLKDGSAPREWETEVGFERESFSKGSVSVVLSYRDRPGFIGPLQEKPNATIPRLLSMLFDDERLKCTVNGFEITGEPAVFDEDNAALISNLVLSPERNVPLVLVSPTSEGSWLVDPAVIVNQIMPNALVYCTKSPMAMKEANNKLMRYGMHCGGGTVRVYLENPRPTDPKDMYRHRYIMSTHIIKLGEDAVYTILRRALAQDVHFWEKAMRLEDVYSLNKKSSLTREHNLQKQQIKDATFDEAFSMVEEAENEKDSLSLELMSVKEENRELKERLYVAENAAKNYELALESVGGKPNEAIDILQSMQKIPNTRVEIATLLQAAFCSQLAFTERAWKTLEESNMDEGLLWEALHDMATILHPLYKKGGNVFEAFNNQSAFEVARGEGRQTRRDPSLMRLRKDTYLGREIVAEPHISSNYSRPGDPRTVRIYYAWDDMTGKLVISYFGHMDNYSTRSLS